VVTAAASLQELAQRLFPQATVGAVEPTPIANLYEVRSGNSIVYMDARGRYVLVGELYDFTARKNFTAQTLLTLNAVKFEDLPLDKAIRLGPATAAKRLARPQLDARILRLVKHRLVDPGIRDQLRQRVEALRARTADEAASSRPTLEGKFAKLERKIPAFLDRLTGRAVERVLADLEESSPEALRDRLKALVRRVMVHGNGKIEVEGTYEPLLLEELEGAGYPAAGAAETVRRMLVPGERHPHCAHFPSWEALLTWREELPVESVIRTRGALWIAGEPKP
jgi:hypothetical protein